MHFYGLQIPGRHIVFVNIEAVGIQVTEPETITYRGPGNMLLEVQKQSVCL